MAERNKAVLIGIGLAKMVNLLLPAIVVGEESRVLFLKVGEGRKISCSFLDNPLSGECIPEMACAEV